MLSLCHTPLRRRYSSFRWVTRMRSVSPIHSPVEKPAHVCSAFGDGCGRPSMYTGRSTERSHSMCHTDVSRETGSTSFHILSCEGPREMYALPCGRHFHSGSV